MTKIKLSSKNDMFKNAINLFNISRNTFLMKISDHIADPVQKSISEYIIHLSIVSIELSGSWLHIQKINFVMINICTTQNKPPKKQTFYTTFSQKSLKK